MLIHILTQNPQALLTIVDRTPVWVGYLLLALLALGVSQMLRRRAGLLRVFLTPVAMTALSVQGMVSAIGATTELAMTLAVWLGAAAASTALAMAWRGSAPRGTSYDAATRRFDLPGSAVPLGLIVGIFVTKYLVGVEMAMQGALAHDIPFLFSIAAVYGAFNGIFSARTLRLWRLTRAGAAPSGRQLQAANT